MAAHGLAVAVRRVQRRAVPAGLILAATAWLATAPVPAPGSAAGTTWTVAVSPSTIDAGKHTTMKVTFSNLGGPSGDEDLGCVTVAIPAAFNVLLPVVTDVPSDMLWFASETGNTTVVIQASGGGDRLPPDDPSASVTVTMSVTSLVSGQYTWTATPYRSQDCKEPFGDVALLTVKVNGGWPLPIPTPTPTPRPTPTAIPSSTTTPAPTVAGTQPPAATADPTPPSATSEPTRIPTPTSSSDAVPTPSTPSTPPVGSGSASGGGPTPPDPPIGAGLLMPGMGAGNEGGGGAPAIDLTSAFTTPFGEGFAWAVPGLVLSVPGLLLVLAVIGAQAVGAFAWLPVVRRRIGGFGIGRRPPRERRST